MKRIFFFLLFSTFLIGNVNAQTSFTFSDLMKVRRVGDPQISPDGRMVAYTIGNVDMAANKTLTQIYIVPTAGGEPKQISKGDKSNSSPRWSPDGKKIAFTNGGQIWTMDTDGGDRKQVTTISTSAGNPVWSPDGKWIAFISEVYPECAFDECNKQKDEANDASKVQAHVTDRLLYRHWVEWRDRKRTHVLVVSSEGGVAKDLTPGDFDAPPYAASTGFDYAFSPDSKEVAFLRNPDKVEAISTNSDIYIVPVGGGEARDITASNKGYDVSPAYTPNGKYIIYRSQATEGFEADRWRIMRYNRQTGVSDELTVGLDLQAEELVISPDSKMIYFTAGKRGLQPIYSVPVESAKGVNTPSYKNLIQTGFSSNLNVSPDGKTLVFLASSVSMPPEVYRASVDSPTVVNLSRANAEMNFLQKPEDVEWTGAMNQKIHGFLLKPANFDASKKYPLLVLIHGGPQSAWNNNWGYRWNPQIFANQGYVVFMPNPRGSTGYGQKFVNDISADWGGKAYVDIMNGVANIIKNPYIDRDRIGAAGASYGGYMVDWILGHNNDPRFKFKAFVSHAGVYNLESMAGATEELWFVNYEFKGMPWENPVNYQKWSPHKFAANFNTPTLVTAGEIDYRVPVDQDYQLFTALQLKGVPSKLVVFPDEGHWILKPQNSQFWYGQVTDWFAKYLKQ
ncbi:MAG: S9 family peptidase [Acidobacteriota bacterium]|nr:S9 family peptidase [Acidobacteriota bacterium]